MMGITKKCRICLKFKKDLTTAFSYYYDEYLPTIIYNISGVKISRHSERDVLICLKCVKSVFAAQEIILTCQESDQYLDYITKQNCVDIKPINVTLAAELKQDEANLKETSNVSEYLEQCDESDATQIAIDDLSSTVETTSANANIECDELDSSQIAINEYGNEIETKNAKPTISKRRNRKRDQIKTPHYTCDICEFHSKTGKQLISHKRDIHKIHDVNIYACTLCPRRFSWKPSLNRHIENDHNVIPEEKKYLCTECGKAYSREVHLIEHTKQRHEPRRYKCADPNCEQTFARPFTLRRHFLGVHSTNFNKRYHCADCNKNFKIYDLWKYHNEVVHSNNTVYCPQCGYPFRHKNKLEEHLKKNVCKNYLIPCSHCQRRFTNHNGLKDHLKKIHKLVK